MDPCTLTDEIDGVPYDVKDTSQNTESLKAMGDGEVRSFIPIITLASTEHQRSPYRNLQSKPNIIHMPTYKSATAEHHQHSPDPNLQFNPNIQHLPTNTSAATELQQQSPDQNCQSTTASTGELLVSLDAHEFIWRKDSEKYLVSLLLEDLDKYRSPQIKKKVFWECIRARFVAKYGNEKVSAVTADSLAKKLANLKRRYLSIKSNNNKWGSGRALSSWHLYDMMDEFFKDDETITFQLTKMSPLEFVGIPNVQSPIASSSTNHMKSHILKRSSQNDFDYRQKKYMMELEKEKISVLKQSVEQAKALLKFKKNKHQENMAMRERELKVEEDKVKILRQMLRD